MKTAMLIGVALSVVAGAAVAQNPSAAQPRPAQRAAPGGAVQRAQRPAAQGQQRQQHNRAQLEQQVRDRIGEALKQNLALTDEQFTRLQATNRRFEERRHLLVEQERDARMGMRDLMITGDTTNQAKMSAGLDRMLQVQRQRMELTDLEQKELAGFLTPMQRAKYLGMQEQIFRRVEAMRQQAAPRRLPRRLPGGPPMGAGMGPGNGQGMGPGNGPGMGPGMGPGVGPGVGQGMGPGMGGQPPMTGGRNPQRPVQGQVRPGTTPPARIVPPMGEIIP